MMFVSIRLFMLVVIFNAFSYCNNLDDFHGEKLSFKITDDIILSASPSMLNKSGEWVVVTFSGVQNPSHDDIVAVYSPSTVNMTKTSPVKYIHANRSSTYMNTGSGSYSFNLINMHTDYIFAFVQNNHTVSAVSNTVGFKNYGEPLQGHLSLTSNPTEMRVSWASGTAETQYLLWGFQPNKYIHKVKSDFFTYNHTHLCGSPAKTYGWKEPGYLQTALISNLDISVNSTTVYYIFGHDSTGYVGGHFQTTIPVGSGNNVKFIAYGDMGVTEVDGSSEHYEARGTLNTTHNIYEKVTKEGCQFITHIGDIAYARGYSPVWDSFMNQISPIAMRVPYMTSIGNHERDFPHSGSFYNGTDSGGECGVPYEHRFLMPDTDHHTQWYSFNFGNVHIVMMSTEHDFYVNSTQYKFLLEDLQNVNRSQTPYVIFTGHRPMYVDSVHNSTRPSEQRVATEMRAQLEQLLFDYNVTLALWGHNHSYQRTCPIYQLECTDGAPTHVVIGVAGHLEHAFEKVTPDWIKVKFDRNEGYAVIETTESELNFSFHTNSHKILDKFSLPNTYI